MPKGTVKWFNKEKGFGFISPDQGDRDIYMISSNIETEDQALQDGQRVEYENSLGRKGPEAIKIRPI
jgi:CspA family cold shock protein